MHVLLATPSYHGRCYRCSSSCIVFYILKYSDQYYVMPNLTCMKLLMLMPLELREMPW